MMMQASGRRLTASDRSTRPRRPAEWLEARALFERLPRVVAERVRSLLRAFVTSAANRVGFVFVELGMMLRIFSLLTLLSARFEQPSLRASFRHSAMEVDLEIAKIFLMRFLYRIDLRFSSGMTPDRNEEK